MALEQKNKGWTRRDLVKTLFAGSLVTLGLSRFRVGIGQENDAGEWSFTVAEPSILTTIGTWIGIRALHDKIGSPMTRRSFLRIPAEAGAAAGLSGLLHQLTSGINGAQPDLSADTGPGLGGQIAGFEERYSLDDLRDPAKADQYLDLLTRCFVQYSGEPLDYNELRESVNWKWVPSEKLAIDISGIRNELGNFPDIPSEFQYKPFSYIRQLLWRSFFSFTPFANGSVQLPYEIKFNHKWLFSDVDPYYVLKSIKGFSLDLFNMEGEVISRGDFPERGFTGYLTQSLIDKAGLKERVRDDPPGVNSRFNRLFSKYPPLLEIFRTAHRESDIIPLIILLSDIVEVSSPFNRGEMNQGRQNIEYFKIKQGLTILMSIANMTNYSDAVFENFMASVSRLPPGYPLQLDKS